MTHKDKMPLVLKGAWLNLTLVTAWLVWFLLWKIASWLFVPLFAIAITILLFAYWVCERNKNTEGSNGVQ